MTVRDLLALWGDNQGSDLRALSLLQPWGSLMALGEKTIETRSWRTHRRGAFAIHSSARWDPSALEFAVKDESAVSAWRRHGQDRALFPTGAMKDLPLGALVAVSTVVSCYKAPWLDAMLLDAERKGERAVIDAAACGIDERAFGNYAECYRCGHPDSRVKHEHRYGFVTARTHRLVTPIPCKGNRSFWRMDEETRAALLAADVVPAGAADVVSASGGSLFVA